MSKTEARAQVRVIPGPTEEGFAPNLTRQTKVMVGDVELEGVYKLVLTAEPNDIWRAEIHAYVQPPEVMAAASLFFLKPERWWQKALRWMAGAHNNVTGIGSPSFEYRR